MSAIKSHIEWSESRRCYVVSVMDGREIAEIYVTPGDVAELSDMPEILDAAAESVAHEHWAESIASRLAPTIHDAMTAYPDERNMVYESKRLARAIADEFLKGDS